MSLWTILFILLFLAWIAGFGVFGVGIVKERYTCAQAGSNVQRIPNPAALPKEHCQVVRCVTA